MTNYRGSYQDVLEHELRVFRTCWTTKNVLIIETPIKIFDRVKEALINAVQRGHGNTASVEFKINEGLGL